MGGFIMKTIKESISSQEFKKLMIYHFSILHLLTNLHI